MATLDSRLVDGTPLSPQQLGLMGMEALETVVSYWEDALTSYAKASNRKNCLKRLPSPDEVEFTRMLESILDGAYRIQDQGEKMFIYQHSVLNRDKNRLFETTSGSGGGGAASARGAFKYQLYKGSVEDDGNNASTSAGTKRSATEGEPSASRRSHLISVSTVDQESFVSAQDTIADLGEFEDLEFECGELELYHQALEHLKTSGIPCRILRTEFVRCESDADYLAKLHCLRLGFKRIMEDLGNRKWWADTGRQVLSDLLVKAGQDPEDFFSAYDDMIAFLNGPKENVLMMSSELESKGVKCINFYDVAFDYILLDSFQDLESPPSSVVAVMKNRWLSSGFKETAMQTAIWSVISAKRRLLKYPDGFRAKFYNISEIVLPVLAWGFFGTDEELNRTMTLFKEQVLDMIRGMYDFGRVRYSSIEALAEDVMALAKSGVETSLHRQADFRHNAAKKL